MELFTSFVKKIPQSLSVVLAMIGIALLPLFYLPQGFEVSKSQWLVVLVSTLFLLIVFEHPSIFRRFLLLDKLIVFWWLILSVASLESNLELAFWGEVYRWQGLVFFCCIGLLMFLMRKIASVRDRQVLQYGWLFGAVGSVLYGLFQKIQLNQGIEIPLYAGRIVSTFGQPNFWADFLLVGLAWWIFSVKKIRKIDIFVAIISGLGIILSGSRLGVGLYVFIIGFRILKRHRYLLTAWIGVFITVILFTYQGGFFHERLAIWQVAWERALERPLLGYGVGNLGSVIGEVAIYKKGTFYVDRSHNIFLDQLLYGGIIGLGVFLWLIFRMMKENLQRRKYGLLAALAIWIATASIHVVGTVGWVYFGLLMGLSTHEKPRERFILSPIAKMFVGMYFLLMTWIVFSKSIIGG